MPAMRLRALIALCCLSLTCFAFQANDVLGDIILSEVYYDRPAGDDLYEWIEIFNAGPSTIDLSSYSIGYGGIDYTFGTYQLSGMIASGQYFVVGGPNSDASNGNPVFNLAMDFDPDLQNSGAIADGIALFDVLSTSITSVTVPINVVIYGGSNDNNLIDETGNVGAVDVGDAPSGSSITFDGSSWSITSTLTPGSGNLVAVPEPAALTVLAMGGMLVGIRRRRR